jgi:anthranilate synthase component 2
MILLLDNYDSFTYNLAQYLMELSGEEVVVCRNDEVDLQTVERFDRIVLSPGPGLPSEAGCMPEILRLFAAHIPVLGICLGHQAIVEAYGGQLRQLDQVLHGLVRKVTVTVPDDPLFLGVPAELQTGRYHSWVADEAFFPADLQVLALGEEGSIQVLKHCQHPVYGIQFHPESVMTPFGKKLLANWLSIRT